MITLEAYFGAKPHDAEQEIMADDLLTRVNALIAEAEASVEFTSTVCPNTGTQISGSKGGTGDGGFRLPTATTGSPKSSHKQAKAVDVFDPLDKLDEWLDKYEHGVGDNRMLAKHGLYRESPAHTPTWCHLQTRVPLSGRRTFNP